MITQDEYLWAWFIYLAGVALAMLGWWWLTAKIRWSEVRQILRLILGVALVVPWYSGAETEFLAPAWISALLEGAMEGDFWRAGFPLVISLGVTLFVSLVYQVWRGFQLAKKAPAS